MLLRGEVVLKLLITLELLVTDLAYKNRVILEVIFVFFGAFGLNVVLFKLLFSLLPSNLFVYSGLFLELLLEDFILLLFFFELISFLLLTQHFLNLLLLDELLVSGISKFDEFYQLDNGSLVDFFLLLPLFFVLLLDLSSDPPVRGLSDVVLISPGERFEGLEGCPEFVELVDELKVCFGVSETGRLFVILVKLF